MGGPNTPTATVSLSRVAKSVEAARNGVKNGPAELVTTGNGCWPHGVRGSFGSSGNEPARWNSNEWRIEVAARVEARSSLPREAGRVVVDGRSVVGLRDERGAATERLRAVVGDLEAAGMGRAATHAIATAVSDAAAIAARLDGSSRVKRARIDSTLLRGP